VATAPSPTGATIPSAEEATRLLYERYARRIFALSLRRLGTREEADDAVQTTFLYAFRSLQRGVSPRHELAWLLKIAENVCRGRRRTMARRNGHESAVDPSAFDAVAARVGSADELFSLPEALAGMPPAQRRAILLREWRGLSYEEIGDELGVSHSAVEALLFRARRSLAARLERALRSLFGPLGLARSLLGGGAAKVAVTVAVVAGTSLVAAPPSERAPAEAEAASQPGVAAEVIASPVAAAERALRGARPRQPQRSADRTRPGPIDSRMPARWTKTRRSSSSPPAAPAGPGAPPPESPPRVDGGEVPAPATDPPTAAATRAGAVETAVSTDASGPLPAATVDAGATTPVGTVDVGASLEPQSPDPVTGEAAVPPLPQPPSLP